MTQPGKICSHCLTPAPPDAAECAACRRPFEGAASASPQQTFSASPVAAPSPPYMTDAPYTPQYAPTSQYAPATQYAPASQYAAAPQHAPVPKDVSNKRILAGIMAVLLGGLGVHKFILGKTQAGVIMLLVSLLTFGIAAPLVWLVGLVEGIVYLTKSDADFYQTYLVGDKQWL